MKIEEIDFTDAQMLRNKAEDILNTKQLEENIAQKEADAQRLLHELQVHQIELEMQNEELRQAYEKAELALRKYTLVFELSTVGYYAIDANGSILDLNFAGADILGERRFSLVNTKLKLFISDESKFIFNDFLKNVFSSHAKESCEVLLLSDQNTSRSVFIEGVVIEDYQECLLTLVDISNFGIKDK